MLKIALIADGRGLDSVISGSFADGKFLLIVDAQSGTLLRSIARGKNTDAELARIIVDEDCEAVISGPIEEVPFVILADEGCCTRYNGAGEPVLLAVDKMNGYALPLIPDFIGGTGCHPGDASNCAHRHD